MWGGIMKHYIRSNANTSQTAKIYEIDVIYDVGTEDSIDIFSVLCSYTDTIKPIKLYDGRVDEQALADYDAFVSNVYECLSYYFDIVDIQESNRSETSYYFWLYAKNTDNVIATEVIIRLRLSDHQYPKHHSKRAETRYVSDTAQAYKRPATKPYQRWKIKNIVVNDTEYDSYDAAETAIELEMKQLSKRMLTIDD